ncbi:MAG: molybdopterin-binding protein [Pseudomonadota bacterium]
MTQIEYEDASNPNAAMLVIGDEILSGRTRDANMYHLAGRLTEHGVDLCEVRVVCDEPDAIIDAVKALSKAYDHVFTSGGIGPTHDDITADCVARAFGAGIDIREDARAILAAHYETQNIDLNPARLRMARIPDDAILIPNPISAAPGFSLKNVHVMAGVPVIFEAMVEGLLPRLTGGAPVLSETLAIFRGEGEIAAPLGELAERYPGLSFGCYPFQRDGAYAAQVVIRGRDRGLLSTAMAELRGLFSASG